MIFDISDFQFKMIFSNKKFHLPIRWDNKDFFITLKELLDSYLEAVQQECSKKNAGDSHPVTRADITELKKINKTLLESLENYLNGFPAQAFKSFERLMKRLERTPLKTYAKSVDEQLQTPYYKDPLNLYRVTYVNENIPYGRERVFHTPYFLRSKVSTSRYSIAGFPSLYLGTSLELCCEEVNVNPYEQFALASRFQLERNFRYNNTEIKVIELAIKPQDFISENIEHDMNIHGNSRVVGEVLLRKSELRSAYLLWYPLIAACSFIRADKKSPFSAEYIIPQLLMQWIRTEISTPKKEFNRLIGIRYFSCASIKASNMGFNYVFPASGKKTHNSFCPTLVNSFKLTKPYFLHEFSDIYSCEQALKHDRKLSYIL